MSKVTVYHFKGYDIISDEEKISKHMATIEYIQKHNFIPIKKTAKEINASNLDSDGLYRGK